MSEKQVEFQVEAPQGLPRGAQDHAIADEHDSDPSSSAQDEQDYSIATGRQRRQIRPPQRYAHADMVMYALTTTENIVGQEPSSYSEAVKSEESAQWCAVMIEEIESLHKNQT